MTRLSKVSVVAGFELRTAIRRPAYLFMTFGFPLFFALVGGLPAWAQRGRIAQEIGRVSVYGVVDESGLLHLRERASPASELPPAARAALGEVPGATPIVAHDTVLLRPHATRETLLDALLHGTIEGAMVVPADYVEAGRLLVVLPAGRSPLDISESVTREHVRTLLLRGMLAGGLPQDISTRVRSPLEHVEVHELAADGTLREVEDRWLETMTKLLVPIVLSMLLLMALMTTSGYLVQAIGTEKENKIVEVMLATIRPQELLFGKLLGLGAAGLLQFAVWAGGLVLSLAALMGVLGTLAVAVPWEALAWSVPFFAVGYLFYGSLMLGSGSLGDSASESQKLTLVWGLVALIPMLLLPMLVDEPQGVVAIVLSWIPFTAPLTVVLRLAADPAGVDLLEIVGSLAVLMTCTFLSVRIGARLFRVGVLLSGSWPGWRQVLRQAEITE